jgi:hypothetical protein
LVFTTLHFTFSKVWADYNIIASSCADIGYILEITIYSTNKEQISQQIRNMGLGGEQGEDFSCLFYFF